MTELSVYNGNAVEPYQSKEAEQWRLKTAVQRVEILKKSTAKLAGLLTADDAHNTEQASRVFEHVFAQAEHLDEIKLLTGATGESNELYNQARGLTIVKATTETQKLAVLIQVVSALLTGNQVHLNRRTPEEDGFDISVLDIFKSCGVSEFVFTLDYSDNEDDIEYMLSQQRLAQVAIIGSASEVQEVSAKLSKTKGILTQVIAIIDQEGLSEVFNPDYLHRFCTERVRTINTTAIGGNASLLELGVE